MSKYLFFHLSERLISYLEEHKIDEPRIFQAPKYSPSSLNSTEIVSKNKAHQKLQQYKQSVAFKPGDNKEKICIGVPFYSESDIDDLQEATLINSRYGENCSHPCIITYCNTAIIEP